MTHPFRTPTRRAAYDPRRHPAVRFLIHGGLLPARLDEHFLRRLKFIVQARQLGLTLADIRQLLGPVATSSSTRPENRPARTRMAAAS